MLVVSRQRGISLIEVVIALAVAALLMAAAMPTFTTWIHNTQIRTGSEALLNGLQLARSEALRRNTNVQFALAGNTGWRINLATDPDGTPIQARSTSEGSTTARSTITPGDAEVVTFNALGRRMASNISVATPPIQRIDIDSTMLSSTDARALRITISDGGQIRLCDPSVSAAGDSRAC